MEINTVQFIRWHVTCVRKIRYRTYYQIISNGLTQRFKKYNLQTCYYDKTYKHSCHRQCLLINAYDIL